MKLFGLRNIKTAVAVFICLMVNILLIVIFDQTFALTWYSPFFAGIATAYSVQVDHSSSARQARNRSVGSLIGGGYGLIICLVFEHAPLLLSLDSTLQKVLFYFVVALAILPLILLTVKVKQAAATFVTILTYLSVTISFRNNLPVIPFAINRILSTIFGVLVALAVNQVRLPHHRNQDILFVCGLDGTLLQQNQHLSGFSKYQLNHLIDQGTNITIATTRTPSSLFDILHDVHFKLPLIIMNGSIIYDAKTKKYQEIKDIKLETKQCLSEFFHKHNQYPFTYAIVDDILTVYHTEFTNPAQQKFYDDRKNDFFKNNIRGEAPLDDHIVYYILIDKCEVIRSLQKELKNTSCCQEISTYVYPFQEVEGYCYLKINSREASKQTSISYFSTQYNLPRVVALGAKSFDVPMMIAADYSIALSSADPEVKAIADFIITSNQPDDMVRTIEKIYHTKNFDIIHHILQKKDKTHSI
ncbi:MAG: HAD hydrolase family protein [Bacilli bacterium]|nr:HAD hydrolase family protein [Bacilli bacterium]